jgi:hypothetical protein
MLQYEFFHVAVAMSSDVQPYGFAVTTQGDLASLKMRSSARLFYVIAVLHFPAH